MSIAVLHAGYLRWELDLVLVRLADVIRGDVAVFGVVTGPLGLPTIGSLPTSYFASS